MQALKEEKIKCEDNNTCIVEMNSKIKDLKTQYKDCK